MSLRNRGTATVFRPCTAPYGVRFDHNLSTGCRFTHSAGGDSGRVSKAKPAFKNVHGPGHGVRVRIDPNFFLTSRQRTARERQIAFGSLVDCRRCSDNLVEFADFRVGPYVLSATHTTEYPMKNAEATICSDSPEVGTLTGHRNHGTMHREEQMTILLSEDAHEVGATALTKVVDQATKAGLSQERLQMRLSPVRRGLAATKSVEELLGYVQGAAMALRLGDLKMDLPTINVLVDAMNAYTTSICTSLGIRANGIAR
jgi:hypothetical protein